MTTLSGALDPASRAAQLGIEVRQSAQRDGRFSYLRKKIAIIAQGAATASYALEKTRVYSAAEAGTLFGFGSPIHIAASQLLPATGDGVGAIPVYVCPLAASGLSGGIASAFRITPVGTQTTTASYRVKVNNILSNAFTVAAGELGTDLEARITSAVNAVLGMPVVAVAGSNVVDLTAKWEGASGEAIRVSVVGPDYGITFGVTQTATGAADPDVQDGLDMIGTEWISFILNGMLSGNSTALDAYSLWNEGRWAPTTMTPAVVFTGTTESDVNTIGAITDARKTDRTNSFLPNPGSDDLPIMVAARELARIAVRAQTNAPTEYGDLMATGLTPGADSVQWDFTKRDAAYSMGMSSVTVLDGQIYLTNILTCYHPTGQDFPGYQKVVDIIKLMEIIYNTSLIFGPGSGWGAGPLIPDDEPTNNERARKPSGAKTAESAMLDQAGLNSILVKVKDSKAQMQAGISGQNKDRLDMLVPIWLSGNANQTAITLEFGFYFGN